MTIAYFKRLLASLFIVLCLSITLSAQDITQDVSAETPTLTDSETLISTEAPLTTSEPTADPLTPIETETEIPATEIETATEIPEAAIPLPLPTLEVTAPPATETIPAPAVPTLPLAYNATFDGAYPSVLSAKTGWIEVSLSAGKALQTSTSPLPITYTAAIFADSAVEGRFWLNSGEGRVTLRGYSAGLSATGLVTVYQNNTAVISSTSILAANTWNTLRLQIVGTQLQVRVNGALVLDYAAPTPIDAGQAGFAVAASTVLRVDDFAVYGTPLSTNAPTATTPAPKDNPVPTVTSTGLSPLPGSGTLNVQASLDGSTNTITLTWTDTGHGPYKVYRGSGTFLILIGTTSSPTFTVSNVPCGLTIRYHVTETPFVSYANFAEVTTTPCVPSCDTNAAIQRVSIGTNNQYQITGEPYVLFNDAFDISADGRYVLLASGTPLTENEAGDLALEITTVSPPNDLYLHDRQTCTTTKVSFNENGSDFATDVGMGDLSNDGTRVLYSGRANDGNTYVYINNLVTHIISRGPKGSAFDMSDNGRYLLMNVGPEPVPGVTDTNNTNDIVVYDTLTSTYSPVSVKADNSGTITQGTVYLGDLFTANGKVYVLYFSDSTQLIANDTNGKEDVFLRNVTDGVTSPISLADNESQLTTVSQAWNVAVVGSTLYIPFYDRAREGGANNLYLRTVNLSTPGIGSTVAIGRASGSSGSVANGWIDKAYISANGRWVAFASQATNLSAGDTNGVTDIFVRDLMVQTTQRVSVRANGTQLTDPSSLAGISDDGSTILIQNAATSLVANDTNGAKDVFAIANPLYEPPAPLDTPVLNSPTHQATLDTLTPAFSWAAVTDATSYEFQLDDDASFTTPLIDQSGLSTTTFTPTASLSEGSYLWRVRAHSNEDRLSEWSAVRTLTLDIVDPTPEPLDMPVLSSPTHQATLDTLTPVFSWAPVTDATSYDFQLDDDASFTTPLINQSALSTATFTPAVPLSEGSYLWRVRAHGNEDRLSEWSVVYAFTITGPIPAPRAPTLISPTNGHLLQPNERPTTLGWSWGSTAAPDGAPFTYDVEVSTSSTFSTTPTRFVEDLTESSYVALGLEDGTYYWRVRATNQTDISGDWSAAFGFTLDTQPLTPAPVVKTPLSDTILTTARPTFTWSAVPGAAGYRVEVNHDDVCGDEIYNHRTTALITITSYAMPASLPALPQGTYTVCVTAYDQAGNPTPSENLSFTIFLGTQPTPGSFIPTTTKPSFAWAAALEAGKQVTYRLQIDDTANFAVPYIYESAAITGTTHIATRTLPAGSYYWRVVRIINSVEEAFTSPVSRRLYSGTLSAGPAIVNPGVNQLINSTTLTWSPAIPPNGLTITDYEVVVAKTTSFAPVVASRLIPANGSLAYDFAPALNQNRVTHYGRVRGMADGIPVTQWTTRAFIVDTVPPIVPVFTAPLESALVNSVYPQITWKAVAGAVSYDVTIYDPAAGVDIVAPQTVSGTSFVPQVNLPQTLLLVKVRANDGVNIGDWATRMIYVRLGTLPPHNSVITTRQPTFTWLAVPGATSYTLQIDDDITFDQGDPDNTILRTIDLGNVLFYTLTDAQKLPANGLYVWRVKANTGDYPTLYAHRTFYLTTTAALQPINLAARPNGISNPPDKLFNANEDNPIGLTWNAVTPPPVRYDVQIAPTSAFTTGMIQLTATSTSRNVPRGTLTNGLKYWRVRAVFSIDGTSFGSWSAVNSFTLDTTPPNAPMSTASTVLTRFNTVRPRFAWSASPTAAHYRVTIMDDATGTVLPNFNAVLVTGTSYTPAAPLPQRTTATYSWIVVAEDTAGNISAGFIARPFTIFVGKSPTNGQIVADITPVFTWTAPGGSDVLWLQIARDATMSDVVYEIKTLALGSTQFTLPTANALVPGAYYWRVIASTHTNKSLVQGQPFTVVSSLASITPKLTAPINTDLINAAELGAGLNFTWIAGTGLSPMAYRIEIARSTAFTTPSLVYSQDVNTTNHVLSGVSLADGVYHWRVRGLFGVNQTPGPSSAVYSFRVDQTAPTSPMLKTPISGSVNSNGRPTFAWGAAAGAPTQYVLQIATDTTFAAPVRSIPLSTAVLSYTLTTAQSLSNGTYYWRLHASDAAGNFVDATERPITIAIP